MKRISYWAKTHKQAARLIIITSFFVLTGLGIITGSLLSDLQIKLAPGFLTAAFCIYMAGFAWYPSKRGAKTYNRQKTADLALAIATFCMIVYGGNQPNKLFETGRSVWAALPASVVPGDGATRAYKTIKEFAASMKDADGKLLKWKERKQLLKQQIKAIKKDKSISKGGKTALIALSVIVALGLLLLVGALACNISCSGAEGAAIAVGFLGAGLVIFLLIVVIKAINRSYRKGKNKEQPTPDMKTSGA